jgi:peptide/nickel transport system substrate-binding protein
MKNMTKVLMFCFAVWMVLMGAFSVSAQEITIAIGSEPMTLDPQLREDGGERAVTDNINETLVARTSDGKLVPGLAAAMPKLVDPETWDVKLRSGVKFHNGEPFNADAVVFSIKRIIDPKFNSEQISFFETVKDAKAVDGLTVRIVTKGPEDGPAQTCRFRQVRRNPCRYGSIQVRPVEARAEHQTGNQQ